MPEQCGESLLKDLQTAMEATKNEGAEIKKHRENDLQQWKKEETSEGPFGEAWGEKKRIWEKKKWISNFEKRNLEFKKIGISKKNLDEKNNSIYEESREKEFQIPIEGISINKLKK